MPIQSSNSKLSGRISLVAEFEHFSSVQVEFSNMSIVSDDSSLAKQGGMFIGASALSLNLMVYHLFYLMCLLRH